MNLAENKILGLINNREVVRSSLLFFLLFCFFQNAICQLEISGEQKVWHKINFIFQGENTNELAEPNPFLDYRFQIKLTSPNGLYTFLIPGYYAGDKNAGENSANSGNIWKAHFVADTIGTWQYELSYRRGDSIAIIQDENVGENLLLKPITGSLQIEKSDKPGRDLRAKGFLKNVGKRYLQFQGNKSYFLKIGADAPENTLAYIDFDATPNDGGFRKNWAPHLLDYDSSSAHVFTWNNHTKGKGLLGAIRYLSDLGANAFSFLTFSLAGDDKNVFPHVLKVPMMEYENMSNAQQWNQGVHKLRFDNSKLAQWENIFEYADQMGMFLHFKTMETENDQLMDDGQLGVERKLYYRELIARFGHHLALNWNISEEISLDQTVIAEIAYFINEIDPYNHPIVFHTYPGDSERYDDFLASDLKVDGASLQVSFTSNIHDNILSQVQKGEKTTRGWIVSNDEQGPANKGIDIDAIGRSNIRKDVVYGTLFAGGAGVEFYYGYQTGCSDLDCQDHRTREIKYKDGVRAVNFFKENIPFENMQPADSLISGASNFAMMLKDSVYLFYLKNGGEAVVDISSNSGTYSAMWFNTRSGATFEDDSLSKIVGQQNIAIGPPPNTDDGDWILHFTRDQEIVGLDTPIINIEILRIFPNPTEDKLNVICNHNVVGYEIFNNEGKLIQKGKAFKTLQLDISNYANGIYFFNGIRKNGKIISVKFLKI